MSALTPPRSLRLLSSLRAFPFPLAQLLALAFQLTSFVFIRIYKLRLLLLLLQFFERLISAPCEHHLWIVFLRPASCFLLRICPAFIFFLIFYVSAPRTVCCLGSVSVSEVPHFSSVLVSWLVSSRSLAVPTPPLMAC